MSVFDVILGVGFIMSGVLFAVLAERLFSALNFGSRRMQYIRAASSLVIGLALVTASSLSNSPVLIRVVGMVAAIGGLVTFFLPHTTWERITRWWIEENLTLYRIITVTLFTLLGGWLVISGFA